MAADHLVDREVCVPEANPRRPKPGSWKPKPEIAALLRTSGNPINGVGETTPRKASPFFWHPPDQHPWGDLQLVARQSTRDCPGATEAFGAAYCYPELQSVSLERNQASSAVLTEEVKSFALTHEADDIGITALQPMYVFDGYQIVPRFGRSCSKPWRGVASMCSTYRGRGFSEKRYLLPVKGHIAMTVQVRTPVTSRTCKRSLTQCGSS